MEGLRLFLHSIQWDAFTHCLTMLLLIACGVATAVWLFFRRVDRKDREARRRLERRRGNRRMGPPSPFGS